MPIESCDCCTICNQQNPCDGVLAGGMCDDFCECEENEYIREEEARYDYEDWEVDPEIGSH
jgi:hypothetical protein